MRFGRKRYGSNRLLYIDSTLVGDLAVRCRSSYDGRPAAPGDNVSVLVDGSYVFVAGSPHNLNIFSGLLGNKLNRKGKTRIAYEHVGRFPAHGNLVNLVAHIHAAEGMMPAIRRNGANDGIACRQGNDVPIVVHARNFGVGRRPVYSLHGNARGFGSHQIESVIHNHIERSSVQHHAGDIHLYRTHIREPAFMSSYGNLAGTRSNSRHQTGLADRCNLGIRGHPAYGPVGSPGGEGGPAGPAAQPP